MLRIKLVDGTNFRWTLEQGWDVLSNTAQNVGVAELARLKQNEIDYVDASGEELKFLLDYMSDGVPCIIHTRSIRWSGEFGRFIAVNLRSIVDSRKHFDQIQKKRKRKNRALKRSQ